MEKSIFKLPFKVFIRYFFYKNSQYWRKQKIEKFQDKQLIKLIKHASKNVPYYRQLFAEIKLNVDKFKGREDLHKIPILEKETIRKNKELFIADNAKKYGITWDSTSGSTGTPLHFVLSDAVQANKIAALLRSFNWAN